MQKIFPIEYVISYIYSDTIILTYEQYINMNETTQFQQNSPELMASQTRFDIIDTNMW